MRKKILALVVIWAALLLCGSVSVSFYRHNQFEEHLENNIADFREGIKISSRDLEDQWNALDTSNPEEVLHYLLPSL